MRATALLCACLLGTTVALAGEAAEPPTLEEKVGQMLMVGFRGLRLADDATILRDIRDRNLGGVVLYSFDVPSETPTRNVRDPDQLRRLVAHLRRAAPAAPLLIAVDQEGGSVRRLKSRFGFGPNSTAARFGALDDVERTAAYADRTAAALVDVGINVNFAPVVDLDLNPNNPVIGAHGRSFGKSVEKVVRHALAVVRAHRARRVITTLKHFPGHGSSEVDSHRGLPDITRTWKEAELAPFRRMLQNGACDAVMTAHLYNLALDPDYPATLSRLTIDDVLRRDLGFDGVVFSDDMQMGAISGNYGEARAVELAIEAGVDILVFANNSTYDEHVTERIITTVKSLINRGELDPALIDRAYQRITQLKTRL